MSKKIIKYYPYSAKEIEIYKKETSPQESYKTELINNSLINLRRKYLFLTSKNDDLKRKTQHFAKVAKSKRLEEIVRVIRYYLEQN